MARKDCLLARLGIGQFSLQGADVGVQLVQATDAYMAVRNGIPIAGLSQIEDRLNDPEFYRENAASAAALHAELEAKRSEVKALYDRWEELEAALN